MDETRDNETQKQALSRSKTGKRVEYVFLPRAIRLLRVLPPRFARGIVFNLAGESFPGTGDPEEGGADLGVAAMGGEFLRLLRMAQVTLAAFLRRFLSHSQRSPALPLIKHKTIRQWPNGSESRDRTWTELCVATCAWSGTVHFPAVPQLQRAALRLEGLDG